MADYGEFPCDCTTSLRRFIAGSVLAVGVIVLGACSLVAYRVGWR